MFGFAIVLKLSRKIAHILEDTMYSGVQEYFSGRKDEFQACEVY